MTRSAALFLAAAFVALPAVGSVRAQPAKPAPKAAATGPYDATNPQNLMDLLTAAGAKAASNRREGDSVFIAVTSTAANFSVQFAGCNASGRACQAVLFDGLVDLGTPTLSQMNAFNQASVVCRIYQDKQSKPHVTYAALLLRSDTRDSGLRHLAAWQGCLAEGAAFVRDPNAYLATAP